jgi:hypothetical protein
MPFPGWIAARILDPKQFESFATQKAGDGIRLILGIKGGKTTAQSYRFDAKKWTLDEARAWLKDHKLSPMKIEPAAPDKKLQAFTVNLQCYAQELTREEIIAAIDEDVLHGIQEKDKHPLFRAYSICHDGMTRPKLLGESAKYLSWPRRAVRSIQAFIGRHVPFFRNHNADNSTAGREKLGWTVGNMQKEIEGKLHHIVIGYFPPEKRRQAEKLTMPSMEAVWNFVDEQGQLVADSLKKMTGIALAAAGEKMPAFRESTLLGAVQAFDETDDLKNGEPEKPGKDKQVTKEEVKQAVKDLNLWPNQLFGVEQIKEDSIFRKLFEEPAKQIESLTTENQTLKTAKEALEKEKGTLTTSLNQATVKDKIGQLIEAKKLTAKEKAFVEGGMKNIQDFTDAGIDSFIESQRKEYQERVAPLIDPVDKSPQDKGTEGDVNPWLPKDETEK